MSKMLPDSFVPNVLWLLEHGPPVETLLRVLRFLHAVNSRAR